MADVDTTDPNADLDDLFVSGGSTEQTDDDEIHYDVECILAQSEQEGVIYYLVKWIGYSKFESTWEPEDMFDDPETLLDWGTKKAEIDAGTRKAFNVERWENQKEDWEAEQRRNERKEKLGEMLEKRNSRNKYESNRYESETESCKEELPRKTLYNNPKNVLHKSLHETIRNRRRSENQPTGLKLRQQKKLAESAARFEKLEKKQPLRNVFQKRAPTEKPQPKKPKPEAAKPVIKKNYTMQHSNRLYKRDRREPAPNVEKLALFRPAGFLEDRLKPEETVKRFSLKDELEKIERQKINQSDVKDVDNNTSEAMDITGSEDIQAIDISKTDAGILKKRKADDVAPKNDANASKKISLDLLRKTEPTGSKKKISLDAWKKKASKNTNPDISKHNANVNSTDALKLNTNVPKGNTDVSKPVLNKVNNPPEDANKCDVEMADAEMADTEMEDPLDSENEEWLWRGP